MIKKIDKKMFLEELDINQIMQDRKKESFDSYILTKSNYIYIDLNKIQVLNDEFGHTIIDEYLEFFETELYSTLLEKLNMAYWSRVGGNQYIIFGLLDNNLDIHKSIKELNDKLTQYISLLYLNKKHNHDIILHQQEFNKYGLTSIIIGNTNEDKSDFFKEYTDFNKIFIIQNRRKTQIILK